MNMLYSGGVLIKDVQGTLLQMADQMEVRSREKRRLYFMERVINGLKDWLGFRVTFLLAMLYAVYFVIRLIFLLIQQRYPSPPESG